MDHPRSGAKAPGLKSNVVFWRLVALGAFVLIWAGISTTVDDNLFPSPAATAEAAVAIMGDGTLAAALGQSILVYLGGYFLAVAVAIPLGLVMGGFRLFGETMEIYVNALTATPRVAFVPLIIVFFGLDFTAKVIIVWLGAIMPILVNTYAGVRNADPELIEMARAAGASNRQVFVKIMLPCALPYIIAGMRLGAGIGLINTVVAELYTALTGLGNLLALYGNTFQMAHYFVVVLALATIGVVMTQGLKIIETRFERWKYSV